MSPVAVSVGTFDGVHLGHRRLLGTAGELAAAAGLPLVAVTLDRHPLALLHPERAPRLLTGLAHKLELLAASDAVARTEVIRFDHDRADQSPESFVVDTLAGDLGAAMLVVGGNFRFGHAGAGDLALASQVGERVGLSVVGIPLVEAAPGVVVSSSAIRRLVATGHLARAADLLGRPHEVRGRLVPAPGHLAGDGGSGPSAGLLVEPDLLLPAPGTYEVRVRLLDAPAAARPSVPALARVVPAPLGPPAPTVLLDPLPGERPHPSWPDLPGAPAAVAFPGDPLAPAHPRGASSGATDR